jgi:hypothetical protein
MSPDGLLPLCVRRELLVVLAIEEGLLAIEDDQRAIGEDQVRAIEDVLRAIEDDQVRAIEDDHKLLVAGLDLLVQGFATTSVITMQTLLLLRLLSHPYP